MLIEAQMPCDDQARHVDVLCFTKSDTGKAVPPVDHHTDQSDTDRAVGSVALETDAKNDEEDIISNSSEEDNILNDSAAPEHPHTDHLEADSAVQTGESPPIADTRLPAKGFQFVWHSIR